MAEDTKKDVTPKKEEEVQASQDNTEQKKPDDTTTDSPKENKNESKVEKEEEKEIPDLKPGMTVRVYQKIKELNAKGEEKERIQYFEGMIIAMKHGKEQGATITVRKISNGVGVEKIFPLNLPTIDKIEIKKQARVRRAKLYFLKRGYKKKLKEVKNTK